MTILPNMCLTWKSQVQRRDKKMWSHRFVVAHATKAVVPWSSDDSVVRMGRKKNKFLSEEEL